MPTSSSTPTATTNIRRSRITDLVQPILTGEADIVIADRQVHLVEHFSRFKIMMQKFGSRIVNLAAGTDLPDAASGFRAYSRESIMLLNTITRFSYCMETIIQAGNKKLSISSIPVRTNPKTRESRLFKSTRQHILNSAAAIIRAYIMYKPYVIFTALAGLFGVLGLIPFVRFAILQFQDNPGGHLQSLIIGTVLLIIAFLSVIIGIISDLIRTNRMLIEDTLEHTKKMRFGTGEEVPERHDLSRRCGSDSAGGYWSRWFDRIDVWSGYGSVGVSPRKRCSASPDAAIARRYRARRVLSKTMIPSGARCRIAAVRHASRARPSITISENSPPTLSIVAT